MLKRIVITAVFSAAVLIGGCGVKQQFEPVPIVLSQSDMRTAMDAAEKTLVKMNFVISKADNGVIVTKPLAAGQFFEFWRQDTQGCYNRDLANTASIQRTATINLTQQPSGVKVDCNVIIERLSLPENEMDTSSQVYSLFSSGDQDEQRLVLNDEQKKDAKWLPLGRDNRLEEYILKKTNKVFTKMQKRKARNK